MNATFTIIPAAGIQVSGFRLLTVYRVSRDWTCHDSLGRDILDAWVYAVEQSIAVVESKHGNQSDI